jgi:hypothetical protein
VVRHFIEDPSATSASVEFSDITPTTRPSKTAETDISPSSPDPSVRQEPTTPSALPSSDDGAAADAQDDLAADPSSAPDLAPEIKKAVEFRRSLRAEVEQMEADPENFTVLQAAAWVDLGDDSSIPSQYSAGIQQIADELKEQIEKSDLDPSSPEYRRLWNRAVRESDWKFRARYGARAWTRHHIQAHHMAAADKAK